MTFERIDKLKADHLESFDRMRQRHFDLLKHIYETFLRNYTGQDHVLAAASFLAYFAEQFPVTIQEGELLVGTDWHWTQQLSADGAEDILNRTNIGHFIADYAEIVRLGIPGMMRKAEHICAEKEVERKNKAAFLTALKAFAHYIGRYADAAYSLSEALPEQRDGLRQIGADCKFILENPPQTFRQALQMIWFVQIFLETESCAAAISFGRIDQYLFPFYNSDRERGRITRGEALELIMCFYIKLSEGDESSMITVGGGMAGEHVPITSFPCCFWRHRHILICVSLP